MTCYDGILMNRVMKHSLGIKLKFRQGENPSNKYNIKKLTFICQENLNVLMILK